MPFQISINGDTGIFLSAFFIPILFLSWYKTKAKVEVFLIWPLKSGNYLPLRIYINNRSTKYNRILNPIFCKACDYATFTCIH